MLKPFPFNFKEFNITHDDIPEIVATLILIHHIVPGLIVRHDIGGLAMWPSEYSCWRPYVWEINHKRKGGSQHCFGVDKWGDYDGKSKGACDWTCTDFKKNKDKLLESLIKNTDYTRFGIYSKKGFIHCDYKKTSSGKKQVYNSMWKFQYKIDSKWHKKHL